ncbi:MAG: Type III RM methylase [Candidatus Roizmanbacteria bacterium GW2011_GWA2_37_7]|uniref:Type III RM methylase n=1 Tax=Candidatus Roizmanbacteria bacterium GW2011_GWA2_37_7 TaxID=1618481 RepID=A0A0G0HCE0_9BACT|nr:MAG: Type III RM methylase [Candidatus Roizmanbacteria bacterium GW2011_GWA2_37_7]
MQNLLEDLKILLQKDEQLVSEGELLKNKVVELAIKLDEDLIELLLSDEKMKEAFFVQAGKATIFDKDKFIKFVSNKQFLPDSYTAFKNKIGLTENGEFIGEKKEMVLSWPYKDCVLEGGMTKEDQKRDEIFWNQTLAPDEISRLLDPKVFTNAKRVDAKGEHPFRHSREGGNPVFRTDENGDIKDNLIIKGNNLLALHSLKKRFAGKVKLIYIDPPYYFADKKDGDSFNYNSNFKLSTWLVFMRNRLEVAKSLLSKDGSLFIQISDDGSAHLKLLLDDVFGPENFVNVLSVRMKNIAGASGGGEDKKLKKNIEFIYIYSNDVGNFKSFNNIYDYKEIYELVQDYKENEVSWKYTSVLYNEGSKKYITSTKDGDGNDIKIYKRLNPVYKSISQLSKEEKLPEKDIYYKYIDKIYTTAMPQSSIRLRVLEAIKYDLKEDDLITIEYIPRSGRNKGIVYEQFYKGHKLRLFSWLKDVSEIKDGIIYKKELQGTYWDGFNLNNLSKEGRVQLENGKKPEALLQRIMDMATDRDDLVLDYYLGSGTTCAVAHKMGRRYIGIEQLDYGENDSIVRLNHVIKGDQSGISKGVDWKNGGDFVYVELAPRLIKTPRILPIYRLKTKNASSLKHWIKTTFTSITAKLMMMSMP